MDSVCGLEDRHLRSFRIRLPLLLRLLLKRKGHKRLPISLRLDCRPAGKSNSLAFPSDRVLHARNRSCESFGSTAQRQSPLKRLNRLRLRFRHWSGRRRHDCYLACDFPSQRVATREENGERPDAHNRLGSQNQRKVSLDESTLSAF